MAASPGTAEAAPLPALRWCPVMVVATGPDTELGPAVASLGGAAVCLDDVSSLAEDGRVQVGVSGLCIWEDAPTDRRPLVLTSAVAIAPFLARRPGLSNASGLPGGRQPLRSVLDPAVVATTEFFAVFPASSPSEPQRAVNASLAAGLSMPASEEAFAALQGALGNAPKANVSPGFPALGGLGLAVLNLEAVPQHGWPLEVLDGELLIGSAVRLLASPFGLLKPSVFLGAEVCGTISAVADDRSLLLLDARCLPGSEGGVVAAETGNGHLLPLALVAPPFRSETGGRWPLTPALPLFSVLQSVLAGVAAGGLPLAGRQQLWGRPSLTLLAGSLPSQEAVSERRVLESPVLSRLCRLSLRLDDVEGSEVVTSGALVLSASHVLVGPSVALCLAGQQPKGKSFRCHLQPLQNSDGLVGSSARSSCSGRLVHMLRVTGNNALLELRLDSGDLCSLGLAAAALAGSRTSDSQCEGLSTPSLGEGSEVLSVDLDALASWQPGPGVENRSHQTAFTWGVLQHCVGVGRPTLLRCGFPGPGPRQMSLLTVPESGELLALPLAALQEFAEPRSMRVLPCSCYALAVGQLEELQRSLHGGGDGRRWLEQLDMTWLQRTAAGAARLEWVLEAQGRRRSAL
eukprot:TRINITY_DN29530_c0_g1_i1.p1 TRINITY_DN29530_c0_g1~~TRINITY_DN29530_c0_g1_i1.p1  ORF type:complete len:630 (-),score=114.48 TRINITY_DN29530_c0_g1_i1:35-1924(-)